MTTKLLGKKKFLDRDTDFLKKQVLFVFCENQTCFLITSFSVISQRIFLNNISFERAKKAEQNVILVMCRV